MNARDNYFNVIHDRRDVEWKKYFILFAHIIVNKKGRIDQDQNFYFIINLGVKLNKEREIFVVVV